MEKEIGKILKGEYQGTTTEIVVGIKEYNGRVGVDIREFTQSETYSGPTKKGLRIPADKFEEFKNMINAIKPEDIASETVEEKPAVQEQTTIEQTTEEVEEDAGIDNEGYM